MNLRKFFVKPPVGVYWWNSVTNYGDALAPLLLARFADLKKVEWAPAAQAEIFSVGSIIEQIPQGFSGYIVGSGKHKEGTQFNPGNAKILALRGPLTAKGIPGEFGLGDPGILANELVDYQEKQWDLGIVPHWRDDTLAARFEKMVPKQYSRIVISPRRDPITVITEIAACKKIVTSSLHGMIIADAFGIPRRVEYCKIMDLPSEGGQFKFLDYSASIQHKLEFGKVSEPPRNRVNEIKFSVYDAYRELSRIYGRR
jgi:hypothetical protein